MLILPHNAFVARKPLDSSIMYTLQSFGDVNTHGTAQARHLSLPVTLEISKPNSVQVHHAFQVHDVLKGKRTLRRADPIDWELTWAASCQQRYLCTYTA